MTPFSEQVFDADVHRRRAKMPPTQPPAVEAYEAKLAEFSVKYKALEQQTRQLHDSNGTWEHGFNSAIVDTVKRYAAFGRDYYMAVAEMETDMDKYCDLVHYARSENTNTDAIKRIKKLYQKETKLLRDCETNFQHGYNSGILAAARLFINYICDLEQAALVLISNDWDYGCYSRKEMRRAIAELRNDEIRIANEWFPLLDS